MGVKSESVGFAAFSTTPFLSFPHDWGKEPVCVTPHIAVAIL